MKVAICEKCPHYKRCVWTAYYKPNGYHPIGINHAYAYCTKHEERCLDVKKCEDAKNG